MIDRSVICCVLFCGLVLSVRCEPEEETVSHERYRIEGRVSRPDVSLVSQAEWFANTKVFTNTGEIGFLREDGSFSISVPSGSYVVSVMNPAFSYEPIRVDVNSKGKMRARVVDNIRTSQVTQVPYPLRFKTVGRLQFFMQREQWRITDILLNPMVLMTVLPLVLLMIMPKLSDPETRKEMEQMQVGVPKVDMPEMSEIMTSLFGSGQQNKGRSSKSAKRKDK